MWISFLRQTKKRLCPETEPHNNDQKPVTSERSTFLGIVIKARKKARECKAKAVIEIYGNLIGHINSSFHGYHIGNDNTLKCKSQYTS